MESPVYISNHVIFIQKEKDVHERRRKNFYDPIFAKCIVKLVIWEKNETVTQTVLNLFQCSLSYLKIVTYTFHFWYNVMKND